MHLDEGYLKVVGKGDKERIVPIGANATRAILRYREFFRPDPARPGIENLFLSVHAEPMTPGALRDLARRWAAKAGIKQINVHKLRHSFALQHLLAGGDAFSLQKNSRPHLDGDDAELREHAVGPSGPAAPSPLPHGPSANHLAAG